MACQVLCKIGHLSGALMHKVGKNYPVKGDDRGELAGHLEMMVTFDRKIFHFGPKEVSVNLVSHIRERIECKNMLHHPFYKAWMEGSLSLPQLQYYAEQYVPFTDAFPRFVSAIHSQCESEEGRAMLLENLLEEEGVEGPAPHPQLWRDFLQGIGGKGGPNTEFGEKAVALKETYFQLCRSSYAEGLCALYTYEHQIPRVAKLKIEGLAQHYGITDKKTIQFFELHQKADVGHAKACEELIGKIEPEREGKSLTAATTAANSLWDFLTEVYA